MRLGCNSNEQPGGAEVSVYTTFGTHTEADAGAVFVIGRGGLEGTELEEPEPVFTGAFAVGVSEVGRAGAVSCDAARAYGEAAGGEAMSDEGPRSKPSAGIVERLREMEMALCGASLREPQAAKLAREAADEIGRLQVVLDSRDMEIEKHFREIERLRLVLSVITQGAWEHSTQEYARRALEGK